MRYIHLAALPLLALLAACGDHPQVTMNQPAAPYVSPELRAMYSERDDGDGHVMPAIPAKYLSESKKRHEVDYWTKEPAGTIIVDPCAHKLYYTLGDNRAMQYTVSVGKEGLGFAGRAVIRVKREWPRWTPTKNMLKSDPKLYEPWKDGMPGDNMNPLGARALYLYRNGKDTLYRIHGTPYPWTIGKSTTDGCIRLFNQDAADLYSRTDRGTHVIVLTPAQSGRGTVPPGQVPPRLASSDSQCQMPGDPLDDSTMPPASNSMTGAEPIQG